MNRIRVAAFLGCLTLAVTAPADVHRWNDNQAIPAQLYSTTSYQQQNLQSIGLGSQDLAGWDFHAQNLSGARATKAMATREFAVESGTGAIMVCDPGL